MPDDFERMVDAWGRAEATSMAKLTDLSPDARFLVEVRRVRTMRRLMLTAVVTTVAVVMLMLIFWAISAAQQPTAQPARNNLQDPPLRAIDR